MARIASAGRIWRFAHCEYDEIKRQLWVRERPATLQYKPLEVLLALLKAPDHTLSKDQLLGQVWEGEADDPSLKTAINRLRDAFADADRDSIIRTIHGFGYRIVVPVQDRENADSMESELKLRKDDLIPGHEQWKLVRPLSSYAPHTVWLAEHLTTRETHVFKFAVDGVRLQALQREVTLFKLLKAALGNTSSYVSVMNWRFTSKPFFIETEYGGLNLIEWAASQRDTSGLAFETCMQLMGDLASAVAAAHGLGVLHNDLKPSNVLISPAGGAGRGWQVKVADFGIASLQEPWRLSDLDITSHGFSETDESVAGGSSLYRAPEVRPGSLPTTGADIYALGVILFQILCGDFRDTPGPGWEKRIEDPLLQKDIEDTANLDPALRIRSAAELAIRLHSLPSRRLERERAVSERRRRELETAAAEDRERRLANRVASANARRPWLVATMATLFLGLAASLLLFRSASHERDIAETINGFLADDLLARANPFRSGKPSESLVDAINKASSQIDPKFRDEPLIAARLHFAIASALNQRADYADADREYERAAALYVRAQGALSPDAMISQLQRAAMLAKSTAPGSMDKAKALYAAQQPLLSRMHDGTGDVPLWVSFAHGLIQMFDSDAQGAVKTFEQGLLAAEALPRSKSGTNLTVILPMKQSLAFADIRLGQGQKAEGLIREMIATEERVGYTDRPNLLNLHVNLAQAYMAEGKSELSRQEVNRIYPTLMEQLGPQSDLTVTALGVRAQDEAMAGLWDEAARDSLSIHDAFHGKNMFFDLGSLSDGALYQCRGGHYREGELNARKAYETGMDLYAKRLGAQGSFAFSLATCLVGLNRLEEAEQLLSIVDVGAVAQTNADAEWDADMELTRAEIARRHADYPAARRYLTLAQKACTRLGAAPYRTTLFQRIRDQLPA